MALTTANILTRVMNSLRLPESNATQQTRVLDILNEVYRDIMAKYTWYWLVKRQVFNTTAKLGLRLRYRHAVFWDSGTNL